MIEPKSPLPWGISPRHVNDGQRIDKGEDPIHVALTSDSGFFLGWHMEGPEEPGRGDFLPQDAAYFAVAVNYFHRLVAELEQLDPDNKVLRELAKLQERSGISRSSE